MEAKNENYIHVAQCYDVSSGKRVKHTRPHHHASLTQTQVSKRPVHVFTAIFCPLKGTRLCIGDLRNHKAWPGLEVFGQHGVKFKR